MSDTALYLGVYAALGVASSIAVAVASGISAIAAVRASRFGEIIFSIT